MDFLTSILGFFGSLIGGIFNYDSTKKTNDLNYKIHQEDLEYQTKMTQAQWERDDNAHQREVADLEKAGLSPLANTTGSPVTPAQGATNPIAMQAPQFDVSSLINSMVQNKKLDEEKRHNLKVEEFRADEISQGWQELENKVTELNIESEKLAEEFRHNTRLETIAANNFNELVRHNEKEESLREQEQNIKEYNEKQKALIEEMNRVTSGRTITPHWCDSLEELEAYEEERLAARKELYANLGKYQKYAQAESHSENNATGGSLGLNLTGTGGNGSLQHSSGTSDSNYISEDFGKMQEELIREFDEKYPPAMLDEDKSKRALYRGYTSWNKKKAG